MPDASQFLTGKYLTGEGLEPNVLHEATIVSARPQEFEDGVKLVLYTDYQAKGVVCNQTKLKALIGPWGVNFDTWVGKHIIIRRGETAYQGRRVASVEIEPIVAERIAAQPRAPISITSGRREPPKPPEPPTPTPKLDDDIPF